MADVTITSIPTGSTLASTISYANSNISALRTTIVGSIEGRGAATPNLASRTVDETTVAHNASVCTWSAEAGFKGFVVSGGTYSSASGLVATYAAVTAWILQTSSDPDQLRRIVAASSQTVTLTASSDNYVYLKTDGTLGASAVAVGAAAPTLPADTLLLSLAVTNGTTVTTTTDKRVLTTTSTSKHYRSTGFWPAPTSSTNLRLPPGGFEIGGTLFENTGNTDLDVSQSGNFVSGARTSNVWAYLVAANVSGASRFALTTSAPSAYTIIGGAASGSIGRLQYRTISGNVYRYLGAHRLVASGNLLNGVRHDKTFWYASAHSVLSLGIATSFTSVAFATRVPPTSREVVMSYGHAGSGANVFIRENGVTGAGYNLQPAAQTGSERFGVAKFPVSSAQKLDYQDDSTAGGGNGMFILCVGYTETELD